MSEIKPALTAEQWEAWKSGREVRISGMLFRGKDVEWVEVEPYSEPGVVYVTDDRGESAGISQHQRASVAAALLDGQPEGFRWEDVDALRELVETVAMDRPFTIKAIADRIAALLPPRETEES